tara:strand:+ start:1833 stop:2006 length:174 start_codon:yes stop_codon:yes gene_type:complete
MIKAIIFLALILSIIFIFKKYFHTLLFYFKKLSNNSFFRGLALRGILRLLKLIIFKR